MMFLSFLLGIVLLNQAYGLVQFWQKCSYWWESSISLTVVIVLLYCAIYLYIIFKSKACSNTNLQINTDWTGRWLSSIKRSDRIKNF
jgi:hypothetical protein